MRDSMIDFGGSFFLFGLLNCCDDCVNSRFGEKNGMCEM